MLRGRRANAHLLVKFNAWTSERLLNWNPIPTLNIVLIWKTPACLKFVKASNSDVENLPLNYLRSNSVKTAIWTINHEQMGSFVPFSSIRITLYSINFWQDCIIELYSSIRRLVKSDSGTCKYRNCQYNKVCWNNEEKRKFLSGITQNVMLFSRLVGINWSIRTDSSIKFDTNLHYQ